MKEINLNKALETLSIYRRAKEARKIITSSDSSSLFEHGISISIKGYHINYDTNGEIILAVRNILDNEISNLKTELNDLGLELDE